MEGSLVVSSTKSEVWLALRVKEVEREAELTSRGGAAAE